MGKKLDTLLCRHFKTNKFNSLLNLALTRLSILENQRQARCSQATSDVVELLKLGHHENAYRRVEQVIKEQNVLDVLFLIHDYFTLLLDRIHFFEHHKDCPQELLEAVSSLLFAASRIGEFPELQAVRNVLISHFGKDLADRSVELRSDCGVNPEIVRKLSTRHPQREVRIKVLKDIAAENNIVLKLEEASTSTEGPSGVSKAMSTREDAVKDEIEEGYKISDSVKRGMKKFKDVACAAQAAFESATQAAEAARAAVALSQLYPHGPGSPGEGNSSTGSAGKRSEQEKESNDDFSEGEGSSQVDVTSESKRSMPYSEETIEDVEVTSLGEEDQVKLLENEVDIYDSKEETKSTNKTNTTTKDAEVMSVGEDPVKLWEDYATISESGEETISTAKTDNATKVEETIKDAEVMSFREDPVKLLENDVVIYDGKEKTKSTLKTTTTTTTKAKDEQNLKNDSNRVETGHVDHMVPSDEDPIMRKVDLKHPISVRTRHGRGY